MIVYGFDDLSMMCVVVQVRCFLKLKKNQVHTYRSIEMATKLNIDDVEQITSIAI